MTREMRSRLAVFETTCRDVGLDIAHPFNVAWCSDGLRAEARMPDFGRNALGIVVGNTRTLWPAFKRALAADPFLRGAAHPLDDYVTSRLREATRVLRERSSILWAHVIDPAPVPIQRIAEAAGLATIAPSHLSIHPTYGPWIALRAVVVVEAEGPLGPPERASDRCGGCPGPCMPALERAIASSSGVATTESVRATWRAWVEVRDACPEGRSHRYGDDQIEYHYAKNRTMLLTAKDEP